MCGVKNSFSIERIYIYIQSETFFSGKNITFETEFLFTRKKKTFPFK